MAETHPFMQPHGRAVGRSIADDRDHLPETQRRGLADQSLQQRPADTLSLGPGCDIDRVLDDEAVCGTRPEWPRIGVAGKPARLFGHEVRKSAFHHCPVSTGHFRQGRRLELVARRAVRHGVGVDVGDLIEVGGCCRSYGDSSHSCSPALGRSKQRGLQKKRAAVGPPFAFCLNQRRQSRLPRNCSRNVNRLMKSR